MNNNKKINEEAFRLHIPNDVFDHRLINDKNVNSIINKYPAFRDKIANLYQYFPKEVYNDINKEHLVWLYRPTLNYTIDMLNNLINNNIISSISTDITDSLDNNTKYTMFVVGEQLGNISLQLLLNPLINYIVIYNYNNLNRTMIARTLLTTVIDNKLYNDKYNQYYICHDDNGFESIPKGTNNSILLLVSNNDIVDGHNVIDTINNNTHVQLVIIISNIQSDIIEELDVIHNEVDNVHVYMIVNDTDVTEWEYKSGLKKILGLIPDINSKVVNDKRWINALTSHTFNTKNNYQQYEFVGDSVLNTVMAKYATSKIPNITEMTLTLLKVKYLKGTFQSNVSLKTGIPQIGRTLLNGVKYNEDIFESFFGCLFTIGEDIEFGLGYKYCYNLFVKLYGKKIDLTNIELDPKSRVQNILSILGKKQDLKSSWYINDNQRVYRITTHNNITVMKANEEEAYTELLNQFNITGITKEADKVRMMKEKIQGPLDKQLKDKIGNNYTIKPHTDIGMTIVSNDNTGDVVSITPGIGAVAKYQAAINAISSS